LGVDVDVDNKNNKNNKDENDILNKGGLLSSIQNLETNKKKKNYNGIKVHTDTDTDTDNDNDNDSGNDSHADSDDIDMNVNVNKRGLLSSIFPIDFVRSVTSIGGIGNGLPPHKHEAAWLAGIVGRKRWSIFPPSGLSPYTLRNHTNSYIYQRASLNPSTKWGKKLKSKLKKHSGLKECIQNPGDIIYLPALWWHATENLDSLVISVGMQTTELLKTISITSKYNYDQCAFRDRVQDKECSLIYGNSLYCKPEKRIEQSKRAWEVDPMNGNHVLRYVETVLVPWAKGECYISGTINIPGNGNDNDNDNGNGSGNAGNVVERSCESKVNMTAIPYLSEFMIERILELKLLMKKGILGLHQGQGMIFTYGQWLGELPDRFDPTRELIIKNDNLSNMIKNSFGNAMEILEDIEQEIMSGELARNSKVLQKV